MQRDDEELYATDLEDPMLELQVYAKNAADANEGMSVDDYGTVYFQGQRDRYIKLKLSAPTQMGGPSRLRLKAKPWSCIRPFWEEYAPRTRDALAPRERMDRIAVDRERDTVVFEKYWGLSAEGRDHMMRCMVPIFDLCSHALLTLHEAPR